MTLQIHAYFNLFICENGYKLRFYQKLIQYYKQDIED